MEPRPFLVGIAGGTGSGKSTLARALATALGEHRVALLAQDAYYRDRSHLGADERAALNYDVPEAFDGEQLVADLRALREGRPIHPFRYSFATHTRVGAGPEVQPRELVIAEGILLFCDPVVRQTFDLRIFLDAPRALRLERRIARDTTERGRSRESVIAQFRATVDAAHVEHVEPTKACADLVLLNASRLEPLVEIAATLIGLRVRENRGLPIAV